MARAVWVAAPQSERAIDVYQLLSAEKTGYAAPQVGSLKLTPLRTLMRPHKTMMTQQINQCGVFAGGWTLVK